MDVGGQAAGNGNLLHDPSDAARGESCSAEVQQERRVRLLLRLQQLHSLRHVFANGHLSSFAQGHDALLASFAAYKNRFVGPVDIVEVNADQLGVAQTASVKQL